MTIMIQGAGGRKEELGLFYYKVLTVTKIYAVEGCCAIFIYVNRKLPFLDDRITGDLCDFSTAVVLSLE